MKFLAGFLEFFLILLIEVAWTEAEAVFVAQRQGGPCPDADSARPLGYVPVISEKGSLEIR